MAPTKILIVEDEGIVALDLKLTLEGLGYEVIGTAASGEAALAKARACRPDLALVDVILDGKLDGIETADALRAGFDVPVVFLTGQTNPEVLERAKVIEPVGFVVKPYDPGEIRNTIELGVYKGNAERRLRESRQWLATTLSCIDDAVVAGDEEGNLRFLNPAAEHLLGVSAAGRSGSPLADLFDLREAEAGPAPRADGGVSGPQVKSALLVTPSGREVAVEHTVSDIRDGRRYSGSVYVFRDVTARKRAEAERERLEAQLFQAQKMQAVGQLAGGIAHDFNNLLTAILGNITLLKQKCPDWMSERLRFTENACNRAADLVKQLLTFSRSAPSEPEEVNVSAIVREAAEITSVTFGPAVSLSLHLDQEVPRVKADPGQLHQVAVNLLVNARDAVADRDDAAGGVVTVRVFETVRHGPDGPGRAVALSVSDTGTGMTAEVRDRMFEPFYTTKRVGRGTGLGLSVVYGIVQRCGGTVDVRSEVGAGTEFVVTLPAAGEAPRAPGPGAAPAETAVLVVEDESLVREIATAMLEELGYRVIAAADGAEGLAKYREHRGEIRLVLSDVVMPDMSGVDLLEAVRREDPSVKVLLSSGYAGLERIKDPSSLPCPVLEKPYKLRELAERVRHTLGEP